LKTIDLSKDRDSDVAVLDARAKWETLGSEDKEMWEAGETPVSWVLYDQVPTQAKSAEQERGNVSGSSQTTIRTKAAF